MDRGRIAISAGSHPPADLAAPHALATRAALFLTDNLPSRTSAPGARLRCGFVDIDRGYCILEKVSVTAWTTPVRAKDTCVPERPIPQNNGAQATETWHQKNREVSR